MTELEIAIVKEYLLSALNKAGYSDMTLTHKWVDVHSPGPLSKGKTAFIKYDYNHARIWIGCGFTITGEILNQEPKKISLANPNFEEELTQYLRKEFT